MTALHSAHVMLTLPRFSLTVQLTPGSRGTRQSSQYLKSLGIPVRVFMPMRLESSTYRLALSALPSFTASEAMDVSTSMRCEPRSDACLEETRLFDIVWSQCAGNINIREKTQKGTSDSM